MEFLSQTYVALRGPTGAPQTATDTIGKLSDRLQPATLLADRRAAVLALKGLARDCKQDVGTLALPGLLQVLYNDAEVDSDIGKAVLETLNILCEVEDQKKEELGFKHTDVVLVREECVHTLFALLAENNFYMRYGALQLLSTLLRNRRQIVQSYFLTAPTGPASVISSLEDKREIVRNEAISMIQLLVSQSADIQKVLAFEGAFEKLFNVIRGEGGVEGGAVAHEALVCVDSLLRFNSSNQSYFRETGLPPVLLSLLLFPQNLTPDAPAPQEFALQFWDEQKMINAKTIVGIMGLLVGSKGHGSQDSPLFTRCLLELALASNAPTTLKTQALHHLLPTTTTNHHHLNFPLSELIITPYVPVPETDGEEWDRLEGVSALDALVELGLGGEYNGMGNGSIMGSGMGSGRRREVGGLELRTAAVGVFENFVRKEEIKYAIISSMVPSEGNDPSNSPPPPPPTPPLLLLLLQALTISLETSGPLDHVLVSSIHFASLFFSHLIRSSTRCKSLARSIRPLTLTLTLTQAVSDNGNFFVPADGLAPGGVPQPISDHDVDDDDGPQTLIQVISENLSLAFLSRSRTDVTTTTTTTTSTTTSTSTSTSAPTSTSTSDLESESREWDRLIVGYLTMLCQWLWEEPVGVREFLDSGGLGMLVEPINRVSETDFLISSLCVFLLGILYEYNREPGEITRSTISPILNRLGVDTLLGRMSRLREDDRFKNVSPESIVWRIMMEGAEGVEGEVWFDWAFVDFWKSNYYTIQRGLSTDPDQLGSSSGPSAETAMLIASLRDTLRSQSQEIMDLRDQIQQQQQQQQQPKPISNSDEVLLFLLPIPNTHTNPHPSPHPQITTATATLKTQITSLQAALKLSEEKRKEMEKEQEDLLVLLDEVSAKRRRDKGRMRDGGLEVSEDEDEDEGDEGEGDEGEGED
ncbi:p115 like vesicle tethering protein [Lentinula boryana]|uniref:P115 like vesicle tethering protein n=1 Tax=Lentinula boryana TaxID=40481 RepID=A0ABQ8Q9U1_9AGAR|nr:p115 like vesicle tethering protein [Lentinula boryana]